MKKTILVLAAFLITLSLNAQNWETDFNKAKAKASEENRNILLVFSGSQLLVGNPLGCEALLRPS